MTFSSKIPVSNKDNLQQSALCYYCISYNASSKFPKAMNFLNSAIKRPLVQVQQASKKDFSNSDNINRLGDIDQPKNVELILRLKTVRQIYEYQVLENASHVKLVKLGLSRAFLMDLNLASDSGAANVEEKKRIFQLGLNWLFDFELGFYCETLLARLLKNNLTCRAFFKIEFLTYQKNEAPFFRPDRPVTKFSLNIVQLFFDKANLARIIRLLLSVYNPAVFKQLTPSQHYKLLAYLINTTRKQGNYDLINSLFNSLYLDNNSITNTHFSLNFEPILHSDANDLIEFENVLSKPESTIQGLGFFMPYFKRAGWFSVLVVGSAILGGKKSENLSFARIEVKTVLVSQQSSRYSEMLAALSLNSRLRDSSTSSSTTTPPTKIYMPNPTTGTGLIAGMNRDWSQSPTGPSTGWKVTRPSQIQTFLERQRTKTQAARLSVPMPRVDATTGIFVFTSASELDLGILEFKSKPPNNQKYSKQVVHVYTMILEKGVFKSCTREKCNFARFVDKTAGSQTYRYGLVSVKTRKPISDVLYANTPLVKSMDPLKRNPKAAIFALSVKEQNGHYSITQDPSILMDYPDAPKADKYIQEINKAFFTAAMNETVLAESIKSFLQVEKTASLQIDNILQTRATVQDKSSMEVDFKGFCDAFDSPFEKAEKKGYVTPCKSLKKTQIKLAQCAAGHPFPAVMAEKLGFDHSTMVTQLCASATNGSGGVDHPSANQLTFSQVGVGQGIEAIFEANTLVAKQKLDENITEEIRNRSLNTDHFSLGNRLVLNSVILDTYHALRRSGASAFQSQNFQDYASIFETTGETPYALSIFKAVLSPLWDLLHLKQKSLVTTTTVPVDSIKSLGLELNKYSYDPGHDTYDNSHKYSEYQTHPMFPKQKLNSPLTYNKSVYRPIDKAVEDLVASVDIMVVSYRLNKELALLSGYIHSLLAEPSFLSPTFVRDLLLSTYSTRSAPFNVWQKNQVPPLEQAFLKKQFQLSYKYKHDAAVLRDAIAESLGEIQRIIHYFKKNPTATDSNVEACMNNSRDIMGYFEERRSMLLEVQQKIDTVFFEPGYITEQAPNIVALMPLELQVLLIDIKDKWGELYSQKANNSEMQDCISHQGEALKNAVNLLVGSDYVQDLKKMVERVSSNGANKKINLNKDEASIVRELANQHVRELANQPVNQLVIDKKTNTPFTYIDPYIGQAPALLGPTMQTRPSLGNNTESLLSLEGNMQALTVYEKTGARTARTLKQQSATPHFAASRQNKMESHGDVSDFGKK